jgi:hypothetical protein
MRISSDESLESVPAGNISTAMASMTNQRARLDDTTCLPTPLVHCFGMQR